MNPQCWQLIRDNHRWCNDTTGHHDPEPHIFKDLMDMLPPAAFNNCESFLDRQAAARRLVISRSATCMACHAEGQLCPIPLVDLDTGGLPCIDYAKSGKRRKHEGESGRLFILWCKRHRQHRTKLVLLENAPAPWIETITYIHITLLHFSPIFSPKIFQQTLHQ